MKLWTVVEEETLKQLEQTGSLTARQELVRRDINSRIAFQWMGQQLSRKARKPEQTEMPVCIWYQCLGKKTAKDVDHLPDIYRGDQSLLLERVGRKPLLKATFEVPEQEVLLSDFKLFEYVRNYRYLPIEERDGQLFRTAMQQLGITEKMLQDPEFRTGSVSCLRRMVEDSWSRVFELRREDNQIYGPNAKKSIQAAVWMLHKDQLCKVESC